MTITGYSNAIVDMMLGWLKGLANWVLRLFNLAGSVGGSPLLWLSENWLKLLVFFLILGLVLDRLVWLIRWRPYWVWFRKERIIVNDDKFFAHENLEFDEEWEDEEDLRKNWHERDYVVASTVVKRPANDRPRNTASGSRAGTPAKRRTPATASLRRNDDPQRSYRDFDPFEGVDYNKKPRSARSAAKKGSDQQRKKSPKDYPMRYGDDLFGVDTNQPDVSDFYEDEVFNVSNLPIADEFQEERTKQ